MNVLLHLRFEAIDIIEQSFLAILPASNICLPSKDNSIILLFFNNSTSDLWKKVLIVDGNRSTVSLLFDPSTSKCRSDSIGNVCCESFWLFLFFLRLRFGVAIFEKERREKLVENGPHMSLEIKCINTIHNLQKQDSKLKQSHSKYWIQSLRQKPHH